MAKSYQVTLPSLHAAQLAIVRCPARFVVVLAGRGLGKSVVAILMCVQVALGVPGSRVWYIGPTYPDVGLQWDDAKRMGMPTDFARFNENNRTITFPNQSVITFKSAAVGEANLRGGQRNFVVMEEAGSIADGYDIWTKAVRPSLTRNHGRALFIGTPRGSNWFSALYRNAQADTSGEWAAFHYTTADNPFMDAAEIEVARQSLPDRVFRQEYLAEILDDGGTIIRKVDEAVREHLPRAPYEGRFVMGLDWGKHNDWTVAVVLDTDTGEVVEVDRFNQIDYAFQRQRVGVLQDRWHCLVIWAEQNSIGEPNIEDMQRDGLPVRGFVTTAQSKPPLIEDLALAFEKGTIGIPNNEVLKAELKALTIKVGPTGRPQYQAPTGMHDDCVIATALAQYARTHVGLSELEWLEI